MKLLKLWRRPLRTKNVSEDFLYVFKIVIVNSLLEKVVNVKVNYLLLVESREQLQKIGSPIVEVQFGRSEGQESTNVVPLKH